MLPALWYDCGRETAAFRVAYMNAITKEYSRNFGWMLGDWCRAHGVKYIGHVIEDMNAHMRTGYGAGHFSGRWTARIWRDGHRSQPAGAGAE